MGLGLLGTETKGNTLGISGISNLNGMIGGLAVEA